MDTFKAMAVFVRCVELGSLSLAAKDLSTTQPTISKSMSSLEARLGGPLFIRSTRGLKLTTGGERYYRDCKQIVSMATAAEGAFRAERESVTGTVTIAASLAFGRRLLIPRLPTLLGLHPGMRVDMKLGDKFVDLAAEAVDVAFRVAELKDGSLWIRRVGTASRKLVAAPRYLQHHTIIKHPADLSKHECIHLEGIGGVRIWTFTRHGRHYKVSISGRFQTDSSEAVRSAALAGLGVAVLPGWMVEGDVAANRLQPVLSDYHPKALPVHAVSTINSRHSAKVNAVMNFFADEFKHTLS